MKKVILAISVLLLVAGCSRVALTGRKQLLLVSDSEVMSLSNSSFKNYMKTAKQSTNAANKAMVVRVGQRIANAVETYLRTNGMEDQVRISHGNSIWCRTIRPMLSACPAEKLW